MFHIKNAIKIYMSSFLIGSDAYFFISNLHSYTFSL